jgi:hypothetical protein
MTAGTISVRPYDQAELFGSLRDERAWEHIPRAIPADAAALDENIRSKLADGLWATFTVRQDGRVAGMTSSSSTLATRQGRRSAAPSSTRACVARASTRRLSGSSSR